MITFRVARGDGSRAKRKCVCNPSLGSGLTGHSKTAFSDGLCIFYLPTFQLFTVEKHGTPYSHTHFLLIFPLQSLSLTIPLACLCFFALTPHPMLLDLKASQSVTYLLTQVRGHM